MGNMMPCLNKDKLQESTQFGGVSYLNINIPYMDLMGFGGFQDDDFNYHIDFITRCANLRADNYHITNSDFHKARRKGAVRGMGSKTYGFIWESNKTITRWWFQTFLIFTPIWGRFHNLTNIFQMG